MNGLINKVQLVGRLGLDAEIKTFDSGNKKANIRMATTEIYRDANGEKKEETNWHNVVAWGKLADIVEKYTQKGSEIMVEGKLRYRMYETKEGEKKYVTEIEARELMLMGSPKGQTGNTNTVIETIPTMQEVNDGLPF
jgi:single-strand DNA-binding protein